jgi:hypothetical protein
MHGLLSLKSPRHVKLKKANGAPKTTKIKISATSISKLTNICCLFWHFLVLFRLLSREKAKKVKSSLESHDDSHQPVELF